MNNLKKYKWLVVVIAFIIMFFHLNNNFIFASIGWDLGFSAWQYDSEALVLNKINEASAEGIFTRGGLLIRNDGTAYPSQIGLQAMFFSLIDQGVSFFINDSVSLLYAINVIFFLIVFFQILRWINNEFGFGSATVAYLCAAASRTTLISTRNLYWVTWTMFLGFLVTTVILHKEEKSAGSFKVLTFVFVFIATFVKAACGFEFISSVMIAMETPFVYYAIKNGWSFKKYLSRSFQAGVAALFGFFAALAVNVYQRALLYGSFEAGVESVMTTAAIRTAFFPAHIGNTSQKIRASLESNLLKVLYFYLKNIPVVAVLDVFEIVLIIIIAIEAFFILRGRSAYLNGVSKKFFALSIATAVSFLAPISWFVLAKGHSEIHKHINWILWNIPFTVLGTALCGIVASGLAELVYIKLRPFGQK